MEFRPVWVLRSNDALQAAAVVELGACFGRSPSDELVHLLTLAPGEQEPRLGHKTSVACSQENTLRPYVLKVPCIWLPSEKASGGPELAMSSFYVPTPHRTTECLY